jgi:hypothetical protein
MASKNDNKRKYAADGAEEEAEEAPPKKQKTIGGDDNANDHNDDGNNSSSSWTDDDYSWEPEEGVSLVEEMNLPTRSEEEFLIWRDRSDDGNIFDDEEESHYFSDD